MATFTSTKRSRSRMGPASGCSQSRARATRGGGFNYRFQYYDPNTGEEFLRYDNSQIPLHDAGHHHRHEWIEGEQDVTGVTFEDLETHLATFKKEVTNYDR